MSGDGWVAAAALTWLRTGVVRTSVSSASVALGVGAFILAGLLGAAQLAQITAQIEASEGRPATIAVTASAPLADAPALAVDAVVRSAGGAGGEVVRLTDAGPLQLCRSDGPLWEQQPTLVRVFVADGAAMFPALSGLDAEAGRPAAVLGVETRPGDYVQCGAPGRAVVVGPLGTGAKLPGYQGAVLTTPGQIRSHPLAFDSPMDSRAWLVHVPPQDAAGVLSQLQPVLRDWALTTGYAGQFDVVRVDGAEAWAGTVRETERVLRIIALVLLTVGALGLANVQTVLITQRTRQLALLRAFGATPRSLTSLVVAETLAICLLGALVGTGLAVGLYVLLGPPEAPLTPALLAPQVALAAAASAAVGLISGLMPAMRARRLDVKDALYR